LHHDRIQISSAGTGITANQFEIFGSEDDRLDDSEDLCRTHLSAVDARTIGPTEADLDLKSRRRLPMQNFRLDDGSLGALSDKGCVRGNSMRGKRCKVGNRLHCIRLSLSIVTN